MEGRSVKLRECEYSYDLSTVPFPYSTLQK